MDPYKIILNPIVTEKTMNMSQTENKLVFNVYLKANKNVIREAVEKIYEVKIQDVNTQLNRMGRKTAYVRLTKEFKADDIVSKMGVL